jgi:glycosyltransferase involved in cell wall biosynthesis
MPIPTAFPRSATQRIGTMARDTVNILALIAFCLRNKVDVVHCHLVNMDTRYAFVLKRTVGVKVIVTLRGGEFHHWTEGRPYRRAYVRQILEAADALTALSRSQLEDARRLAPNLPSSRAEVITNPIDADAINRAANAGDISHRNGHSYIVFCGRLEKEKRVDTLISAYHRVIAMCPGYAHELVIAGDGSLSEALRAKARNGPGGRRIRFLGKYRYEDTLARIRDAALLVLPSQESEGCPNVVLEAMALGTPVIVSDHPPLKELVTHGVNGEVFSTGQSRALADRLLKLSQNPGKLTQYAIAGRKHVIEKHQFEQISSAYDNLYRKVTRGPFDSAPSSAHKWRG